MYIDIYVCMCIYIYVCIYIFVYIYICVYIYMCVCACVYLSVGVYVVIRYSMRFSLCTNSRGWMHGLAVIHERRHCLSMMK